MIIYVAQALSLGFLLWCVTLSGRRTDLFIGAYVCVWTVGVILLYWKYGDAQDVFYSNDQRIQANMVSQIEAIGIEHSLERIIGNRYVVTIPAFVLTRIGIDALLALKFLQAVFFVLTYRLVRNHFALENLRFKTWYILLFAGPIFIFMSLLGLRDLALAFFSLYTVIGRKPEIRAISWLSVLLLRPHLAVALIFGRLVSFAYRRARLNPPLLLLPIVVVGSFLSGIYGYVIGAHFQSGAALDFASLHHLLSQETFARFFANFGGLQFLLLGSAGVVQFSVLNLLLLRLVFVDIFLIPSLFLWTVISSSALRLRSVSIYSGFAFFLGLVVQTNFNSSRQNIPFLVLMGVTVAEHFARRRNENHIDEHVERDKKPITAIASF